MTPVREGIDHGRRRLLARGAVVAGAAALGLTALGCSDDDGASDDGGESGDAGAGGPDTTTTTTTTTTTAASAVDDPTILTAADFAALAPCLLAPEQTEGPFYLAAALERRDITEGRPGHPLRLGLRVVDADCAPVPGAVVDVWHADAAGDYSAFVDGSLDDEAGEGTTFLRGSQVATDEGIVEFTTVYPGWYPGRAVHVHVKAHLGGATVLTSQLYFPEDLTDAVHAEAPYADRGTRDTRNEDDGIAGDPGSAGNLVSVPATSGDTRGLVVLGVDPSPS
jgi:protocatechuate 3,4-dioxygenase beta subunit